MLNALIYNELTGQMMLRFVHLSLTSENVNSYEYYSGFGKISECNF